MSRIYLFFIGIFIMTTQLLECHGGNTNLLSKVVRSTSSFTTPSTKRTTMAFMQHQRKNYRQQSIGLLEQQQQQPQFLKQSLKIIHYMAPPDKDTTTTTTTNPPVKSSFDLEQKFGGYTAKQRLREEVESPFRTVRLFFFGSSTGSALTALYFSLINVLRVIPYQHPPRSIQYPHQQHRM